MTTLYDLPKDILVKLITEIQHDTHQENKKLKRTLLLREKVLKHADLRGAEFPIVLKECPLCDDVVFLIDKQDPHRFDFSKYNENYWRSDYDLYHCQSCEYYFCNKHFLPGKWCNESNMCEPCQRKYNWDTCR